jgi:hypothetical protein
MRLLAALGTLATGTAVLLAIVAINGGYVYRTQCLHVGGSTESSWSWRINDLIPYLGYSRSGCEVHTATRWALDAVGVWSIKSESVTAAESIDHRGDYTANQHASMQANCEGKGSSTSFCLCAMDELTRRFPLAELQQISSVTRFDQLPGDLGQRASAATSAISQDCPA